MCVLQFMSGYDDSEMGAPEVDAMVGGEGGGGGGGGREGEGGDQWLLELAVRDFEKNFADQITLAYTVYILLQ